MKAPLHDTWAYGHFGRVFFFFLRAYTTSDLRAFRRTCVHVRKECSLEISVIYEVVLGWHFVRSMLVVPMSEFKMLN